MEDILFLSRALIVNILITIFSSIIPLIIGILLSLLAKKSSIASKILGWLKIPFESICIPGRALFGVCFIKTVHIQPPYNKNNNTCK